MSSDPSSNPGLGSTAPAPSVLVTGAAGFVGSRVVELLSAGGRHRVLATDVQESATSQRLATMDGVQFVAMDLRESDAVALAVTSVDAVVHLAALRLRASDLDPRLGFSVNAAATFEVMLAAAKSRVTTFVYGSSQQIYGSFSTPTDSPMREADGAVGRNVSMYAAAKLACEAFLPSVAARGCFDYLALRFGSIYGPNAAELSNSAMMLDALRAVDRGERARVAWSRGSRHSLVHVDDAARAVVRALDKPIRNVAVNVVGGTATTEDIYRTMLSLHGADPDAVDYDEARSRFQHVDGTRLREDLGCPPAVDLSTGLQSIVDWHRATR